MGIDSSLRNRSLMPVNGASQGEDAPPKPRAGLQSAAAERGVRDAAEPAKEGGDKCCFWLKLLRDPHRRQGGGGGAPAGFAFCRAFGIGLGAGEPHCKPGSAGESLQKGSGWVGWGQRLSAEDQCPKLLDQESGSNGIRSSS